MYEGLVKAMQEYGRNYLIELKGGMKSEMEKNEKLDNEVGTKEAETLEAKQVKVLAVDIEAVKNKKQEDVGEKVVFTCKHPDREDNITLSKVKYLKGESVKTSGTWYNLDADNKIVKNSALSSILVYYKTKTLNEMIGKDINTDRDGEGYLCVKAY